MNTKNNPKETFSEKGLIGLVLEWSNDGHKIAIAQVIETWGSAPRAKGGFMIIRGDGLFEGSVSGGCVEGEVISEAQEALKANVTKQLEYSVSNKMAWEVGLACGGNIRIAIIPLTNLSIAQITEANEHIKVKKTVVLKTSLSSGHITNLSQKEMATLKQNSSFLVSKSTGEAFYTFFTPPIHLYIIGAVHISQALTSLANILNYSSTLIDPRGLFAQKERFKDVTLIEDWPENALTSNELNEQAAVVTLTHDPKIDDEALKIALKSKAFYIGSLGSKKTHSSRIERLKGAGFSDIEIAKIHGPIGLDIGSRTPTEIALSILAEIEGCRTGKIP